MIMLPASVMSWKMNMSRPGLRNIAVRGYEIKSSKYLEKAQSEKVYFQ